MLGMLLFVLVHLARAVVIVGHPVYAFVAPGDGLVMDSAQLAVEDAVWKACPGGTDQVVAVDETMDLLGLDTLTMPEGTWCGVSLTLFDEVGVTGTGGGGSFSLQLDVGRVDIPFASPLTVPPGSTSGSFDLKIAYEDWITATSLGLSTGTHVHIGPTDPEHNALRDAIRVGSDLY